MRWRGSSSTAGTPCGAQYYFNDAGNQIRLLGESVLARARGEEVPAGGYQGEYVAELAAEIPDAGSLSADEAAGLAVDILLARIKATLERYGVRYDAFFSERTLHAGSPSMVERALSLLEQGGHVYRSEGALWLRTSAFGTTRTGWWCGRTTSRHTWPGTSPTCRRSASASSTASSCRSAPTITRTRAR